MGGAGSVGCYSARAGGRARVFFSRRRSGWARCRRPGRARAPAPRAPRERAGKRRSRRARASGARPRTVIASPGAALLLVPLLLGRLGDVPGVAHAVAVNLLRLLALVVVEGTVRRAPGLRAPRPVPLAGHPRRHPRLVGGRHRARTRGERAEARGVRPRAEAGARVLRMRPFFPPSAHNFETASAVTKICNGEILTPPARRDGGLIISIRSFTTGLPRARVFFSFRFIQFRSHSAPRLRSPLPRG